MGEPKVYHAKGKDDWGTTQGLYDALDQEFHFDLDVCANDRNHKCPVYLTEEMNALAIDWWGRCFMNPPHSQTEQFLTYMIQMLVEEKIEIGVAVVASRTDTAVHHMASCFAGETRYLKGRLSYEVFPSDKQRAICGSLQGITIEPGAWPMLVKEVGLPQTAILALMKDPSIPPSDPRLSQSAPFPSLVYIFDRRPQNATVYWDWKKQQRTVYAYQGAKKVPHAPWLSVAGLKAGKITEAKKTFAAMAKKQANLFTPSGIDAVAAKIAEEAPAMFFLGPDGLKKISPGLLPKWLTHPENFTLVPPPKDTGMIMGIDWGQAPPIGHTLADAQPGESVQVAITPGWEASEPPLVTKALDLMEDLLTDDKETD